MAKEVRLKKKWMPVFFPEPKLPHEKQALEFMAVGMLTLQENVDAFVTKNRGKRSQQLKERNAMAIAMERLKASWSKEKQARYREWVEWYRKYGREARSTEVYRSNRV